MCAQDETLGSLSGNPRLGTRGDLEVGMGVSINTDKK